MKKNVIILLLCAALCAVVFAQSESDFKFDGKGTITGYTGSATSVVIPSRIGGVPVTAIGRMAFELKGLTSVIIPNSVTTIGAGAFSMNKFTSITIPASVTFIGEYAFYQTTFNPNMPFPTITSITIGANVEMPSTIEGSNNLFHLYYNDYNRRAGTYTCNGNGPWVLSSTAQQPQQQQQQQPQLNQQQQTQQQAQQQPVRQKCRTCGGSGNCNSCRGTGNCSSCRGTGWIRSTSFGTTSDYKCGVCNGSGKCDWCYIRGSGKCQGCKGTGYYN